MLYWIICAGIHWILTFFTDGMIFRESGWEHLGAYILLKLVLLAVLLVFWYGMDQIVVKKNKFWRMVVIYALPYLAILIVYVLLGNPLVLAGDEKSIFNAVTGYDIYPGHFTYITGLTYGVSLMIFPFSTGVFWMKLVLQSLACGYCIQKANNLFKSYRGVFLYVIFLLPGILQNTIRIHRMQFYGVLYLVLVVKLLADYYENKEKKMQQLIPLMIAFDVLAIWRKEGIYLFVLAPVLICLAYHIKEKKSVRKTIGVFAAVAVLVYLPQMFAGEAFTTESSHTYNQWFVNMCRNGLDQSKYPQQLKDIDKILSIDAVNRINEELGDENYMEEYIAWYGDYVGVTPENEFTPEEYDEYAKAIQYIIIHEPLVFIKTCFGMWNYSANAFDLYSLRGLVRAVLKGLYLPFLMMIFTFFVSIRKKNWLLMWIALGILAHCGVTLVFAPAAYFKYYYQMYMVGNYFVVMFILEKCKRWGKV